MVEATELPRIIRLSENLFAAAFRLMKLSPARHMIDKAEEAELLRPGGTVIETSSGTSPSVSQLSADCAGMSS